MLEPVAWKVTSLETGELVDIQRDPPADLPYNRERYKWEPLFSAPLEPWGFAWQTSYTEPDWHFARVVSFSSQDIDRGFVKNITPLFRGKEVNHSTQALIDGSFLRSKAISGSWECKDFADGWIEFNTISEAIQYQIETGCVMRPKPE